MRVLTILRAGVIAVVVAGCTAPPVLRERSDADCPLAALPGNAARASDWNLRPAAFATRVASLLGDPLLGDGIHGDDGNGGGTWRWNTLNGTLEVSAGSTNGRGIEFDYNASAVTAVLYLQGDQVVRLRTFDAARIQQALSGPLVRIEQDASGLYQVTPAGRVRIGATTPSTQVELTPSITTVVRPVSNETARSLATGYVDCKWGGHGFIKPMGNLILVHKGRLAYHFEVEVGKCNTQRVIVDAEGKGVLDHFLYGWCG